MVYTNDLSLSSHNMLDLMTSDYVEQNNKYPYIDPYSYDKRRYRSINTPYIDEENPFVPSYYGMDIDRYLSSKKSNCNVADRVGYYQDVYGRAARTTANFPYVLQVFSPTPRENRFQTLESAMNEVPRVGDWQIFNVFTDEHIKSPRRQR